jgi:DNA-binding NtrC family response regulator
MQDPGKPSIGGSKLKELLDAYERRLIESALADADGNQRRAAASLGLLPTTLHEKMKRLGLLRRAPMTAAAEGLAGQLG